MINNKITTTKINIKNIEGTKSNVKLGLVTQNNKSFNDTYFSIFFKNIFSLINVFLTPLLIGLFFFQLYLEILVFSTFLIINTIIQIVDECRAKYKIDKLQKEFESKVNVIRNGKILEIPIQEVKENEVIYAKEGDPIITDGTVLKEYYLQVDESYLTGESNYITKDIGDKVYAGSYVVTGECVYQAQKLKEKNLVTQIALETTKYTKKRSKLQRNGDKLIITLVFIAILVSAIHYLSTKNIIDAKSQLLSITTIVSLVIPQTLILLFTFSFTISIIKLLSKGVIVQKAGSIQELSKVNVIFFDKTGTLTTNEMEIKYIKTFNIENISTIANIYSAITDKLVGVNETQKIINKFFEEKQNDRENYKIIHFDQLPFTSKTKFSLIKTTVKKDKIIYNYIIFLGAFFAIQKFIKTDLISDIQEYIKNQEEKGYRVVVGGYKMFNNSDNTSLQDLVSLNNLFDSIIIFSIEETINFSVNHIFSRLKEQNILIKIISGDSQNAINRISKRLNLIEYKSIDLSKSEIRDPNAYLEYDIFARATPQDKLKIIQTYQNNGYRTAMIGDGMNDVLAMKKSNVSISLEKATKITREVADLVLLNNDYTKIPDIFFEGENIILNLKIASSIFLHKTIFAVIIAIYSSLLMIPIFVYPTSTLIFSFLGSSLISYIVVFTR
ncbi:MAG: HAD-IC family P-type ATPase, partial [Candidatus Dojkabacteria bacterium]|nr:HAD-IC family P-type ATPase [Candidatus Dojkabacteria bacterium]